MLTKEKGIAVSEGIGIAKVYKLTEPDLSFDDVPAENVANELQRLDDALQKATQELDQMKATAENNLDKEELAIFDAHRMMLSDPEFQSQMTDEITNQKVVAERAVSDVTSQFEATFAAMTDNPYMQERANDVKDIARHLLSWLEGKPLPNIDEINEPSVVVAKELSPSDLSHLNKKMVRGIVTEKGGKTSHVAIMAQNLEIPTILGMASITDDTSSRQNIIVDAFGNKVILDPDSNTRQLYQQQSTNYLESKASWREAKGLPAVSKDGTTFSVNANIGNVDDSKLAATQGADGVGLFRSEFLYMGSDHLPTEDEQFEAYRSVLKTMDGKPVTVRTLDIGGDKSLSYFDLPTEANPFLGDRAIRISLQHPEIFRTQLRALIRASAYGPLAIMFPMISTLDELQRAKKVFYECRDQLRKEYADPHLGDDVKLGLMIEIPSAALNADKLAQEADFFSIGTNDLLQYLFAADRGNESVSYLYQPFNPVFLQLVKTIIEGAHRHGTKVAMCGEMAGERLALPLLMGMGLDELSMTATSVPRVKSMVRKYKVADCRKLVKDVLTKYSRDSEVQKYVDGWLK